MASLAKTLAGLPEARSDDRPDRALYIVTDEDNGELWKVTPRR